ncbi:tyrosine-type recombinase/integrase [Chloroflexota bacterium]
MLNKLSVSTLAELSNFSKAYISQVKHGKRPPSQKLMEALAQTVKVKKIDYLTPFLQSRQSMNVSHNTIKLYRFILERFISQMTRDRVRGQDINRYLVKIPLNGISSGNRHAHYRVIKTYLNWIELEYSIKSPMSNIKSPQMAKLILPSLTREQVLLLIEEVSSIRNKAIIALAVESGLRVSELARIKIADIDWDNKIIRILGKGSKEAYAPFGQLTKHYLTQWLNESKPNEYIWNINKNGIQTMLQRLEKITGLPCNPHTFRRTFACLLRKAGVDTMTIKDLGRWESLEMVQRYTRSVTFNDSLKFYKEPLS